MSNKLPDIMLPHDPGVRGSKVKGRFMSAEGKKLPPPAVVTDCPAELYDQAYAVASFRAIGQTRAQVAQQVPDVSPQKIAAWEKAPWWPSLYREAVRAEHGEIRAAALGVVKGSLEGKDPDVVTARWLLERLDPEAFGPPKIRKEISGPDGGPIEQRTEVLPIESAEEIARVLREMGAYDHVPAELDEDAEGVSRDLR